MISATALHVAPDASGTTRAVRLRAEAPQLVRVTDVGSLRDPLVAHLCGGAAGPLGGDRWELDLQVACGARLSVRSVAATLVHPGASGTSSDAAVRASVGRGATLDWWPEPLIAVHGCDHHLACIIDLERGAALRWVDEIVCGRAQQAGGRVALHQRVTIDGHVVSDQLISTADATAKVVVTAIAVGAAAYPPVAPIVTRSVRAAVMHPTAGVTVWAAVGDSSTIARAALADLGLAREPDIRPQQGHL